MNIIGDPKRRPHQSFKLTMILDSFCIFFASFLQTTVSSVPGVFGLFNTIASMTITNHATSQGVKILNDLLTKPNSDLILTLDHPMGPIIDSFTQMTVLRRVDHVTSMVEAMRQTAVTSQAPVLALLETFHIHAESYWLTNQIYVKAATPPIIQALMALSAIRAIAEERKIPLMPLFNRTTGTAPNGTLWNVKKINAHKVWREGSRGEGVIVAGIDTGVRATHKALKDNYVGTENFGWFDPILYTNEPNDVQGHGTHTVGTMVGRSGIGAAPRAKWMACKGCGIQSCLQHALIACGQFILCPTDPRSKKSNCSHIPHIVNNSWGGPGGQTWYDDVIAAWRAAGIIPFFANGNNGPQCETAGSPGDSDEVIAVGATDKDDRLAKFSSRGPKISVVGGLGLKGQDFITQMINMLGKRKRVTDCIKPDISAPGHQINSAGIMSDDSYKVQSGTSMATPLTAGAGALLLSRNPRLTMEEMKQLMFSTAVTNLTPTTTPTCGGIVDTEFPNHMFGHGRLDIYKAYKKMLSTMKLSESTEAEVKRNYEKHSSDSEDWDTDDSEEVVYADSNEESTTSKTGAPKKVKAIKGKQPKNKKPKLEEVKISSEEHHENKVENQE